MKFSAGNAASAAVRPHVFRGFPRCPRCRCGSQSHISDTRPPLRYRSHAMLTPAEPTPPAAVPLLDAPLIAAELKALAKLHAGHERELRIAVAQRLKTAVTEGRAAAEKLLLHDRRGRLCAERLCFMQDEIIRILFEFAKTYLY